MNLVSNRLDDDYDDGYSIIISMYKTGKINVAFWRGHQGIQEEKWHGKKKIKIYPSIKKAVRQNLIIVFPKYNGLENRQVYSQLKSAKME